MFQKSENSVHHSRIVLRSMVKEVFPEQVLHILQTDFHESVYLSEKVSQEDKRFLTIMRKEIKMVEGHYQMPLPFEKGHHNLCSNRNFAPQRLSQLKRRLSKVQRI